MISNICNEIMISCFQSRMKHLHQLLTYVPICVHLIPLNLCKFDKSFSLTQHHTWAMHTEGSKKPWGEGNVISQYFGRIEFPKYIQSTFIHTRRDTCCKGKDCNKDLLMIFCCFISFQPLIMMELPYLAQDAWISFKSCVTVTIQLG